MADPAQEAFWELFDALAESPRVPDWPYVEPSTHDEIVATLPVVDATPPGTWSRAELTDRVLGGWLGRIAGCNLGKPARTSPASGSCCCRSCRPAPNG